MLTKTTNTINVDLIYADFDERTYKLPVNGEMTSQIINNAKDQIRAFNTAAENSASSVSQTFLSDGGSRVVRIKTATIIQKTEEEIYSG